MTEESELPANPNADLVEVEALCLLSWDGDPATDGSEYYAPPGYEAAETHDSDGKALTDLPSRFVTTRIQASALVKAGAAKIVSDPAAS